MDRQFYIDLARSGLRMPIGTDLVLREHPDHEEIVLDAEKLGKVVAEAAARFRTPLAFPLMDLMIEKAVLLEALEIPEADINTYHFSVCPPKEALETVRQKLPATRNRRFHATVGAVKYVAEQTDLVPVGMTIGPFSLMTKLLADPITPVYLAGTGLTGEDDPEVALVEMALELSITVILHSLREQLKAGAKAVCIAEPAANRVYISPNQLEEGSDIFDRYVLRYNRMIRDLLEEHGADLIFHCCGELTDQMVQGYASLDPAILSLGSSRKLWEDARLVPDNVVLFGNLPTKKFFSDEEVSPEEVERLACETLQKMQETGHPFILGSECDVLSVPGSEEVIKRKVDLFLTCSCH
ncbi:MAG: uroporphyrinogen decarboxylase family protein [Armatimonadota bacterium]